MHQHYSRQHSQTTCCVKLSLFSVKLKTVLRFCRAVVYATDSGGG